MAGKERHILWRSRHGLRSRAARCRSRTNLGVRHHKKTSRYLVSIVYGLIVKKGGEHLPELPEVETIKETLRELVLHKQIQSVSVFWAKIIKHPIEAEQFTDALVGQTILDIKRRGKFLIFYTEISSQEILCLRMTIFILLIFSPGGGAHYFMI